MTYVYPYPHHSCDESRCRCGCSEGEGKDIAGAWGHLRLVDEMDVRDGWFWVLSRIGKSKVIQVPEQCVEDPKLIPIMIATTRK